MEFLSRGQGYTLFLTSTDAVLALRKTVKKGEGATSGALSPDVAARFRGARNARLKAVSTGETDPSAAPYEQTVVRMKLLGANPEAPVKGLEELPGKSNYFLGNDPQKWRTNVPHYAQVEYQDVYPGIDLVYYGTKQGQLEYDFIVAPGTDPKAIQLAVEGAEEIRVDGDGDLVVDTEGGELRFHKPVVYQEGEERRQYLKGRYVLKGEVAAGLSRQNEDGGLKPPLQVGFEIAAYDASRPLIIDPVVSYSTYLGGSASEQGITIAVDFSGNAYVTGDTSSIDFPTANALQPSKPGIWGAFVTKINAAGSALVYSTYLGGSNREFGIAIAVDAAGSVYVTGSTSSTDFPTTAGALQPSCSLRAGFICDGDAFVTKLNATGDSLLYSTYRGGSARERGNAIAVDAAGNAYVTGFTESTDFPTTAGALQPSCSLRAGFICDGDAFVTKLNATGDSLLYSTYRGGSARERGNAIAVDAHGNAYVTGNTRSIDFPTVNAFQAANNSGGCCDAFVTKLNAAGTALVYSTYLGGSGAETGIF